MTTPEDPGYSERDSVLDIDIPYDVDDEWCSRMTQRFGHGRLMTVIQASSIRYWLNDQNSLSKQAEMSTKHLTIPELEEPASIEGSFFGVRMIPVYADSESRAPTPVPHAVLMDAVNQRTQIPLGYEGQHTFVPVEAGGVINCYLRSFHTEVLPLELNSLLPLIRVSYGKAYFGDERISRIFNNVTRVLGLTDDKGSLAAAAMLEKDRIISVATSTDIGRFGNRRDLMTKLLKACKDDGHAYWITVAEQYPRMFTVCEEAGMERFTDFDVLRGIRAQARQGHQYEIVPDRQMLPIFVTNTGPGTGNRQQVWGWAPEPAVENQYFPGVKHYN